MMFLPKIFARADDGDPVSQSVAEPLAEVVAGAVERGKAEATSQVNSTEDDSSNNIQDGVKEVVATVPVWSRWQLYLAFALVWMIYFTDSLHSTMDFSLTAYVTSSFSQHSLTATTSVFSQLIGALSKLPLAKILDIWGRPQGLALTVFFMVVGLIMMAACQNVETYAAAQVFYWIGFNGIAYTLQVFVSDTTELKNRAFVLAFISSPFIITPWISGYPVDGFLDGGRNPGGFRWAYGVFCIVMPVVTAPLFLLFLWNHRKARRMGVLAPKQSSGRSIGQSIRHNVIEFDVLGILLAAAGLSLFLLPFNIYSYQAQGWASPMIICMLVFGVVLMGLFVLYEKYLAPVKFIPTRLLADRTIMGACALVAINFIAYNIWSHFFSSFLQVVTHLSIVEATYVGRIFNVGSCFWGLVVGVLIRWTGRFKWQSFYFGVPVQILGVGLMIYFRRPGGDIGYIIMSQIFIALAGGTFAIGEQIAVMSAVSHKYVAVVLALLAMFSSMGGAIGSSVSSAIWNHVFPSKIMALLPPDAQQNATLIVGSLAQQLSYPVGSPTRIAIEQAYGEAQKIMMISATVFLIPTVVAVGVWRDYKLKDV